MIGIPHKMVCNCQNNTPTPAPKQKLSAHFSFVAWFVPTNAPVAPKPFSEVVIKELTLDGTDKEVEIKLPEGCTGKMKLKAVYVRVDKKGISFEEDWGGNKHLQKIEYKPTAELDDTSTIDPYMSLSRPTLVMDIAGMAPQGEWRIVYYGTSNGDLESAPTKIKYRFTGDTSLLKD